LIESQLAAASRQRPDREVSKVTLKRAALLQAISYALLTAQFLYFVLPGLIQPFGRFGQSVPRGWWQVIFSLMVYLVWIAYFTIVYRDQSQRPNPMSIWTASLYLALIVVATSVWIAISSRMLVAANPPSVSNPFQAGLAPSLMWRMLLRDLRMGLQFVNMALWIAVVLLFAHDPKGLRTRRFAAALALFELASGLFVAYAVISWQITQWEGLLAGRIYPTLRVSLWDLSSAPALSLFHATCMVLFPYALWRSIPPKLRAIAVPDDPPGAAPIVTA
jgi:hypothetical protein